MSGCKYLFFVCRSCLHGVVWFFYWFDNLGLITEGNTYRCCDASSLPLWGNTDVVQANIKSKFCRRCQGDIINIYQVPNQKYHLLAIYIFTICLSFSSPPLHKNLPFYSPSFSFAVFSPELFLSAILLPSHYDSREHQVV